MKENSPPRLFIRFLTWFCPAHLLEFILGDLEEQFEEDAKTYGRRKAKLVFAWSVLHFIRPGILFRRKLKTQYNNIAMIKNYLKIGYRNIIRYKFFSFFNVTGLSIGICMSLFILTHLYNELSYETAFPKYESIYRIASTQWAKMPPKLSGALQEEMPEIKDIGRLYYLYPKVMVQGETQIMVEKPYFADESILSIFDLQFIEGSPTGALDDHYDIVITEGMADRMFQPGEPRVGEIIQFFGQEKYTVTGVIKDLPPNSHLKIDCLVSIEDTWVSNNMSSSWSAVGVYALVDTPADAAKIAQKLPEFQVKFSGGTGSVAENIEDNNVYEIHPITDIHLNSHREKETEANSDMALIYIFSTLVIFILVVVIINFINLYISQTLNRLKEIGIRKVMGAQRSQLAFQFLSEAFLLVCISAVLAVLIAWLVLPFYNQLSNVNITFGDLLSPRGIALIAGLTLVVGFLAGGYPALYLSRFGIDQGLRTKQLKVNRRFSLRTVMVACQFLISVCLLTATLIVSKQMNFINDKDLGFADEEVVAVKLHGDLWYQVVNHTDKVRNELLKNADILQVSLTSKSVGDRFGIEDLTLSSDPESTIYSRFVRADRYFAATMGLTVTEGDSLPGSQEGDHFILNERAASQFPNQEIIGKNFANGPTEGRLVAVVEDFHFASLHNEIEPLTILLLADKRFADYLLIRISSGNYRETMSKIEDTLQELAPGSLIVSHFLNDHIEKLYRSENNLFSSFRIFSTTIIILACLGLFALFAFISQTRRKELGIRKTLGASLFMLLMTMSRSYLGILLLTMVIAAPVTWYFASDWLANFAYRTSVEWWYFVVPGLVILSLAAIAMISQSWRVASSNPIDSLREE
ncbi:MAG: FtsX-like permease family protein [Cyclobacteriaceae bacterium]